MITNNVYLMMVHNHLKHLLVDIKILDKQNLELHHFQMAVLF